MVSWLHFARRAKRQQLSATGEHLPRISQGGAHRPCRAGTASDGKRLELFFLTVGRDKAIEFLQRG